jgi:hypothetical protein
VKAQIEGPATLARCIFLDGVPVALAAGWLEHLAGFLERQVAWQVRRLRNPGFPVLDEPALSLVDGDAGQVIAALRRVLDAARVEGTAVGIHCCAPLPSAFAALGLDLLSFDAHLPVAEDGFSGLAMDILGRGGSLAFGLAPTGPTSMTAKSMEVRWLELASTLGDPRDVAARSSVTATCGLGLSTEAETSNSFTLARLMGDTIRSHTARAPTGSHGQEADALRSVLARYSSPPNPLSGGF